MVKKIVKELPPSMERCLLAFYRFEQANLGMRPTYPQMAATLKCSDSFARYCLKDLAKEGRGYVVRIPGVRYTPWRLTEKGRRLAKRLDIKSKLKTKK